MKTIKIVVVNTMGNADTWWHIHRDGCKDVTHEVKKYRHLGGCVDRHDVDSIEAYIEDECEMLNSDHGEGAFRSEHFRIMPCAKSTGGK